MPILIGIVLIALGGYFSLFMRKKYADETLEIQSQQTKTIPEVREALEAMSEVDPGYREVVEVKGLAQSEQPVQTPYTGETVAYYIAKTVQVSETTETYTDSNGNRRTRTTKHEDVLSEEESGVPLLLKDSEGNRLVIETCGIGNQFDLQKTCDRFEHTNTGHIHHSSSIFRQFNIVSRGNHRILGYKKVEQTFPQGAALYALGEAYMQNGEIYLGPPKVGDAPFVVTTKSEEQLVKSKKNAQTFALFGGIAGIVIGIVVIVASFF